MAHLIEDWFAACTLDAEVVAAAKAQHPAGPAAAAPAEDGAEDTTSETWFRHIEGQPLSTCQDCGYSQHTTRICLKTGKPHGADSPQPPAAAQGANANPTHAGSSRAVSPEPMRPSAKPAEHPPAPSAPPDSDPTANPAGPRPASPSDSEDSAGDTPEGAITLPELHAMGVPEDALFCLEACGPPLQDRTRVMRFLKQLRLLERAMSDAEDTAAPVAPAGEAEPAADFSPKGERPRPAVPLPPGNLEGAASDDASLQRLSLSLSADDDAQTIDQASPLLPATLDSKSFLSLVGEAEDRARGPAARDATSATAARAAPAEGASRQQASPTWPSILRLGATQLQDLLANAASAQLVYGALRAAADGPGPDNWLQLRQHLRIFITAVDRPAVVSWLLDNGAPKVLGGIAISGLKAASPAFIQFSEELTRKGGHTLEHIFALVSSNDLSYLPEHVELSLQLLTRLVPTATPAACLTLAEQLGPSVITAACMCATACDTALPLLEALARRAEARERLIFAGLPHAVVRILQGRHSGAFALQMALHLFMACTQSLTVLKRFARMSLESSHAKPEETLDAALRHCTGHEDALATCVTVLSRLPRITARALETLLGLVGAQRDDDGGPRYLLLQCVLNEVLGHRHASMKEVKERPATFITYFTDMLGAAEQTAAAEAKHLATCDKARSSEGKATFSVWSKERCHQERFMGEGGCFSSINAAIRHAQPYQEIVLTAGHFEENVVVTVPVILRGTQNSVIQSPTESMPGLAVQCRDALIIGLTVKCAKGANAESDQSQAAAVMEGTPTFRACLLEKLIVKGLSDPVVEECAIEHLQVCGRGSGRYLSNDIGGPGAYSVRIDVDNDVFPVFYRNNFFCRGKSGAVLITGPNTSCRLAHNTISTTDPAAMLGAGTAGITVENGALPEIAHNVIQNYHVGVLVRKTGTQGHLRGNFIRNNVTGVQVEAGAKPLLEANFLWNNETGVHFAAGGNGILRQNCLFGTATACVGVAVSGRSNPHCYRNVFLAADGERVGVSARDFGVGLFEHNELVGGGAAAFQVVRGGRPNVNRNYVNGPWGKGVEVSDEGRGKYVANLITHARSAGIMTNPSTAPTFEANVVAFAGFRGLHVLGSKGTFARNLLMRNSLVQVECSGAEADPVLQGNTICDADAIGVLCTLNSRGTYTANQIFAHGMLNVKVAQQADPAFLRNAIHTSRAEGVLVAEGGKGHWTENVVSDNAASGFVVQGQGDPFVNNNRFENGRGNGVWVKAGGQGLFRDNVFDANRGAGLKVSDGGAGRFEHNTICKNTAGGVLISAKGNPVLSGNSIHGNPTAGVLVSGGMGIIENNSIYGNLAPGIVVELQGNPTVRDNHIHDGPMGGVLCRDRGLGNFSQNRIQNNRSPGVTVTSGANPVFERNVISDGEDCGVCIGSLGRGSFIENTIQKNAEDGVRLLAEADGLFVRNTIRDEIHGVMVLSETAHGKLESNSISHCLITNVMVKRASPRLIFSRNDIFEASGPGVIVTGGTPLFLGNRIHNNSSTGVRLYSVRSNPIFANNNVYGHSEFGLDLREKARGLFVNNELTMNTINICVQTHADPIVERNSIRKAEQAGVLVLDHGRGSFLRNTVEGNHVGVRVLAQGHPLLRRNEVREQTGEGVVVHQHGWGVFRGNRIHHNARSGLLVQEAGSPEVVKNHIFGGLDAGVTVERGGGGTFRHNEVYANHGPGLLCQSLGQPLVEHNAFYDAKNYGVLVRQSGVGMFLQNRLSRNSPASLCVQSGGHPRVDANHFLDNPRGQAVRVCDSGRGLFVGNAFEETGGSVVVQSQADPQFHGNTFHAELVLERGALGLVQYNKLIRGSRGVTLSEDANPVVQFNHITGQTQCGVLVNRGGRGVVRHNVVSECAVGVEVTAGGQSLVEANLLRDNPVGVSVHGQSASVVTRNTITGSASVGVQSTDRGSPQVTANHILQCRTGVLISGTGEGTLERNVIQGSAEDGVLITSSGPATIARNFICESGHCGLQVAGKGLATVTGNVLFQNSVSALLCRAEAAPRITDNQVWGEKLGLQITEESRGVYDGNKFTLLSGPGILVEGGANPTVTQNQLSNGDDAALLVRGEGTRGTFERNEVFSFRGRSAVVVVEKARPDFRLNDVSESGGKQGAGLLVEAAGFGEFAENTLHHLQVGVLVTGECHAVFTANQIQTNTIGVLARAGGRGQFRENRVYQCKKAGVQVEEMGDLRFEKNVVSDNVCGLVLQPRSHGVVQDNIFIDNTQWAAEISLETLTEVHGNRFFSPSTDPPISDSRVVMRFGARNDIRTESRTVKELPTWQNRSEQYHSLEQAWRRTQKQREALLQTTVEQRRAATEQQMAVVLSRVAALDLCVEPQPSDLQALEAAAVLSPLEDLFGDAAAAEDARAASPRGPAEPKSPTHKRTAKARATGTAGVGSSSSGSGGAAAGKLAAPKSAAPRRPATHRSGSAKRSPSPKPAKPRTVPHRRSGSPKKRAEGHK
eukprot:EG_transcript_58